MTTPNPPTNGETNWGTPLNQYLAGLQADETTNEDNFSDHISAAPATATLSDPHGDRAYALGLMAPILSLVNQANGFVQLSAAGLLPGDTWHDLRPLSGSFTGPTGQYPPQYRMTLDGKVELAGYVVISATTYNGVQIFPGALPGNYRPNMQVPVPVTVGTGAAGGFLLVASNGTMTFTGLPTGLAAGTLIGIWGSYPLDAPYSLLQS